jgi:ketosteroid isomerase-like protein
VRVSGLWDRSTRVDHTVNLYVRTTYRTRFTVSTLTAADRIEIQELCARYDWTVDTSDVEGWVALFAADGSFESPMGSATGHDELRSFLQSYLDSGATHSARHATGVHVTEGDGTTARHTGYLTVYETHGDAGVVATGVYTDRLAKVDGEWKLTHRQLSVDPSFSFEEQ